MWIFCIPGSGARGLAVLSCLELDQPLLLPWLAKGHEEIIARPRRDEGFAGGPGSGVEGTSDREGRLMGGHDWGDSN